jgi:hypothetical protein
MNKMKIITMILALSLLLMPMRAFAETDQEIQADLLEADAFAEAHDLYLAVGRTAVDAPWFARFYYVSGDSDHIGWEEEGYPTFIGAIKAAEADYTTYPKGHSGQYKGKQ